MKICGFTFIRNAVKFDFPVVEAITSILPVCDHFIVAVGNSDDTTRKLIEEIETDKIAIVDTVWDDSLKKGGVIYATETDKAFDAIPSEYDWCFYIQGDEVLHEEFLPSVKQAMLDNLHRKEVDGLLFRFRHFYGTYDYIGDSRKWYRNEIRIIRNNKSIRSYRDAQGFRKNGQKLNVMNSNAEIYHYGWVRPPVFMQEKINEVKKYYKGLTEIEISQKTGKGKFDYSNSYDALAKFKGTHPEVMKKRIECLNWHIEVDLKRVQMKPKYRLLHLIERLTGKRLFEYRNYKLLKQSGAGNHSSPA